MTNDFECPTCDGKSAEFCSNSFHIRDNFKERIADFTTLMANRDVCDEDLLVADYLINDLHAALEASKANAKEFARWDAENTDKIMSLLERIDAKDAEIAELRGLLGEAHKYVNEIRTAGSDYGYLFGAIVEDAHKLCGKLTAKLKDV